MLDAIALGSVLLDQADTALGIVGQDMRQERARRIIKRIQATSGEVITTADLWRTLRRVTSIFDGKEQFDDAIELLRKHGYIAWICEGKKEHVQLTGEAQAAL